MLKKTIFSFVLILVFGVFTVFFCNKIIEENAKIYPLGFKNTEVALVLGTANILGNGKVNLFFKYRIQKAVELYDSGKIKFFVVSGDNGSKEYDEPTLMKNELIKAGIPATRIFCDYAGFSTIDSVLRMKLIFQQTTFYIISQKFHVDRALYIAQRNGLKAKGIFAKDVPDWYSPYLKYREQLARVKAVFEVLTSKSPYYAGKHVKIN